MAPSASSASWAGFSSLAGVLRCAARVYIDFSAISGPSGLNIGAKAAHSATEGA
jgi:hypothetical protein